MIISLRSVGYDELKKQISKEDKIVILSCNTCVVACGIGGTENMLTLRNMLSADGYTVLGTDLISIGCTLNLVEKHRSDIDKCDMYDEATVIIPLICENGLRGIEYVFSDKKVIPIAKTLGVGNLTMDRGVVLTHPFEETGLAVNEEGYDIYELAEKLALYDRFFDEDEAAFAEKEYVSIIIDGTETMAEKGKSLLDACADNGIEIPHLCHHHELSEAGVCRLCLVKVKGMRDLCPACCTEVRENMEVITEDEELNKYRRVILELILGSQEHNCLFCSKGVPNDFYSCELQTLIRKYGIEKSRYGSDFEEDPIDESSPVLNYDPNRCILCGRCVRACEEIAGQCNIGFVNRGSKTRVAAGLNVEMDQSDCAACMACVNVCPTGALSEKAVRFSGTDWTPGKIYLELTNA